MWPRTACRADEFGIIARVMEPVLRVATHADIAALSALIAVSARALCAADYTPAQIEAALGSAWGVDTQLVEDGTYFAAESDGRLVACGGWSDRATLFGSDSQAGRDTRRLDPSCDAARIRAFFVHPAWARRGLGRAILARCEAAAMARGFARAELMATLPGVRLYSAAGYTPGAAVETPLPGGATIPFVPMSKPLRADPSPGPGGIR